MTKDSGQPDPNLGLTRLGRYQLLKKIAVGGMAEIYLARQKGVGGFEKNVVLKRILPQLAESEEFFRMFLDEARIAATLQHPNIVQIYDAGEQDGEHYIAMEYLDGADLLTVWKVLRKREVGFPLELALHVCISVAAGLHYAHEKEDFDGEPLDIVHRDVTPHNVFLTRDGAVKLVDFGIAKASNRITHTSYGTLKGKLAYMSPEQCKGEPVDRRSDIYSLGIIAYELTTNVRLYTGKSEYTVLKEIVEEPITPPSAVRKEYPTDLEPIVMKSLRKPLEERYQTAREMQMDLLDLARSLDLDVTELGLSGFVGPLMKDAKREMKEREKQRETKPPTESPRVVASEWDKEFDSNRVESEPPQPGGERPKSVDELLHDIRSNPPAIEPDRRPATGQSRRRPSSRETRRSGSEELGEERPDTGSYRFRELSEQDRWEDTPPPALQPSNRPATLDTGPMQRLSDPGPVDLRTSNTAAWLLACVLVAVAAGLYWYFEIREPDVQIATTPQEDEATKTPELGTITLDSSPTGATAWLLVGRSPVTTIDVSRSVHHVVKLEQPGYRTETVAIAPDSWTGSTYRIELELSPPETAEEQKKRERRERRERRKREKSGEPEPAVELPESIAVGETVGQIEVHVVPESTTVWLRVGVTPHAQISRMRTDVTHEFRFERAGHAAGFAKVNQTDFSGSDRANIRVGLRPVTVPK